MKYSDEQRLENIKSMTGKLRDYLQSEHITPERVLAEEPIRWAITTPLYNIGEQAYNLSDEFKSVHANIEWAKISGLRHRLVHDYDNTNWELICRIIFEVLPKFCEDIQIM